MPNIIDFPQNNKLRADLSAQKLQPYQLAALKLLKEKAGLYSGIRKDGKQPLQFDPAHPHANLYRRGDVVALVNHPEITGTVIESFYSIHLRRVIGLLICFQDYSTLPIFTPPHHIFVIRAKA